MTLEMLLKKLEANDNQVVIGPRRNECVITPKDAKTLVNAGKGVIIPGEMIQIYSYRSGCGYRSQTVYTGATLRGVV